MTRRGLFVATVVAAAILPTVTWVGGTGTGSTDPLTAEPAAADTPEAATRPGLRSEQAGGLEPFLVDEQEPEADSPLESPTVGSALEVTVTNVLDDEPVPSVDVESVLAGSTSAPLAGPAPDRLASVDVDGAVEHQGGPVIVSPDPLAAPQTNDSSPERTGTSTTLSTTTTTAPSTTTTAAPTTSAPATTDPTTSTETTMTTTTTTGADSTSPIGGEQPGTAGMTLVFEENFDQLDTTRWRREFSTYGDGNNELQCYLPELVSVEDGALTLRARRQNIECVSGDPRTVTSGMVRSSGITYGPGQRVEFRARMNIADTSDMGGLWPAFWASSWNGGGWPRGGELDVLEWISKDPNRTHHSVHWLNDSNRHQHWSGKWGANLANQWHTFGFEWTTTELRWYVDGELAASVDPRTFATADGVNPFTDPSTSIRQFKINLALGGSWGGPLGSTALDAEGSTSYQVDYIRIYDLG